MHRVIIDTDTGIDDAHALLFALMSDDIQVEGITTIFGNSKAEYCTHNVLYLLELVGQARVPVRMGSLSPLLYTDIGLGTDVHGEKGLGTFEAPQVGITPAEGNAICWLVDTVMSSPGEIDLLVLGPQTNIALAASVEPKFVQAVKRVIFMGGTITGLANVSPVATANIMWDVEAAKIVFHAGWPIVMVGREVTLSAAMTAVRFERLIEADTEITRVLVEASSFYMDFYKRTQPSINGFALHDMLVVAYLLRPNLFKTRKLYVDVETQGKETRGQTFADYREVSSLEPQMEVCLEVDDEALYDMYLDVVTQNLSGRKGV